MVKILDFAFQGINQPGLEYLRGILNAPSTLAVKHYDDAVQVARDIAANKPNYVIVTGDKDEILGVLTEPFVNEQLTISSLQKVSDFSEGVLKLAQLARINQRDFPARVRPLLFYCAKGKHYTTKDPCPVHP